MQKLLLRKQVITTAFLLLSATGMLTLATGVGPASAEGAGMGLPDINNGITGALSTPLARGRHTIKLELQQISAPINTIKKLGFNPYDPNLGSNEIQGHAITKRIMQAVKSRQFTLIRDASVIGPNAMTFLFSYPGDASQPFAHHSYSPSVTQTPRKPRLAMREARGVAWTLSVTPHLLADKRFFCQTDIATTGEGEGGINSWADNGEPILLGTIFEKKLIYKHGQIVDAKNMGLHLVIGTVRLLK